MKYLKLFEDIESDPFGEEYWDEEDDNNGVEDEFGAMADERYTIWEIKSYRNMETNEITNEILEEEIPTSHLREQWEYEIYEVLRTTDGEIFRIGDNISTNFYNGEEDDFETTFGNVDWIYMMNIQLRFNFGNLGIPFTDDIKVSN